MQCPPADSPPHAMTHRAGDCGVSVPSSPPLPLTHGSKRVQVNPPLPALPLPPSLPHSHHPTIFSFPFSNNSLASTIAPLTVSRLFPKQFFPSLPLGFLSTSSTSSPKFSSPFLFGCSLSSLSLAAASASAPLLYSCPPLPPSVSSDSTWFFPPSSSLPSVSSSGSPVLNLDPSGAPLTFKSALSGPFRSQWLLASDTELVKLVETTRTLCPVHFCSSLPTYFYPIPKEK
jgi:hypothetical protein